jgi:hypothetical protein
MALGGDNNVAVPRPACDDMLKGGVAWPSRRRHRRRRWALHDYRAKSRPRRTPARRLTRAGSAHTRSSQMHAKDCCRVTLCGSAALGSLRGAWKEGGVPTTILVRTLPGVGSRLASCHRGFPRGCLPHSVSRQTSRSRLPTHARVLRGPRAQLPHLKGRPAAHRRLGCPPADGRWARPCMRSGLLLTRLAGAFSRGDALIAG